ncbi:MAG: bifunctional N-acetylglucosamine-1-phosphate uridyltransferase/glucosamine-1-phosphate acetyltransferase, partial [Hydrogenophaga sp.]|nr:bifunctional N-acetylglucosamine-1-phosphate uridyltransferase/glucosamine-1-phosphate acetyltransferase [Hydrogenophaga sp.]
MSIPVDVVVMAAGKGTRMKSQLPKVLHRLGGRALAQHVIDTAARLSARSVVVITGHGAERVEAGLQVPEGGTQLKYVRQAPQLGTGHAVQQAAPVLPDDGVTLVLSGDVPLTRPETLQALLDLCAGERMALLTLDMPDPTGYGRIVRSGDGSVQAIVEHKDASEAQRAITEIYSGIMAVPTRLLKGWLARLDNQNAQGEYYLTDVVKFAVGDGLSVLAHRITDAVQVAGVNSPLQLAELERAHQRRVAEALMEQGVR